MNFEDLSPNEKARVKIGKGTEEARVEKAETEDGSMYGMHACHHKHGVVLSFTCQIYVWAVA